MNSSPPVSRRAAAFHDLASFTVVRDFIWNSPYTERCTDPGIVDLTFGNPHDMPMPEYVDALREVITPQDKDWFAYKDTVPAAQEAAAASLERLLRDAVRAGGHPADHGRLHRDCARAQDRGGSG